MPQPPRVDHGQALSRLGDRLGLGVEDEVAHRRAGLPIGRQRSHRHGHAPLLPDGRGGAGRDRSEGEGLLAERVTVQRDQRVTALQYERVHDVADGRAAGVLERIPEVARDRVPVGVRLEIGPHAVAEHLGPDVLLEHAQDAAALLVRQHVEHALGLFGRPHRVLDRAGQVERVDGQCGLAGGCEADPAVP